MMKRYEKIAIGVDVFAISLIVVINKIITKDLSIYDRTPYWLLAGLVLFLLVLFDKCEYLPFGIVPVAFFRFYILLRFLIFDPSDWPAKRVPVMIMSRVTGILFLIGSMIFVLSYFNKMIYKMAYIPYIIAISLCIISMCYSSEFYIESVPPLLCFIGYVACYEPGNILAKR